MSVNFKYRELFYVSNVLSLLRIVLVIPIYYLLQLNIREADYVAVILMLIAAMTDSFDGRLARKLKQKSDLGRILDPLADKICVTLLTITLVKLRDLPVWFVVFVISRDVAIVLLGFFLVMKTREMVESNMLGKITVTLLGFLIIAFTLQLDPYRWYLLWLSFAMILISSFSYFFKMLKTIRIRKQTT